jgi:hypothetical protein
MSTFEADFRRTTPFDISKSEIFLRPEIILRSAAGHER